MIKRSVVLAFILLLAVHVVHVIEESIVKPYFIESIYNGMANFLIINILFLSIPLTLLIYVVKKKKIAYYFSAIYGTIMVFDGLDHVIRQYAGIYTGALLIIFGLALNYYLATEIRDMKGGEKWQKN